MLKKIIKLNVDDLLLYLCGEVGIFLLIQIVIGCVMKFGQAVDSILISGVLLPIIAGFLTIIAGIGHVTILFEQALRFGQTRRRALGMTAGLLVFESAFALALAALLALVERYLSPPIWAALAGKGHWVVDYPGDLELLEDCLVLYSYNLDWWWYPAILAIAVAVGLILGAFIQRFGNRGGWIIWGVWMAVCLGPQLFGRQAMLIGDWNQYMLWAGAALGLGCLVWSVWSMFHAVVRE